MNDLLQWHKHVKRFGGLFSNPGHTMSPAKLEFEAVLTSN